MSFHKCFREHSKRSSGWKTQLQDWRCCGELPSLFHVLWRVYKHQNLRSFLATFTNLQLRIDQHFFFILISLSTCFLFGGVYKGSPYFEVLGTQRIQKRKSWMAFYSCEFQLHMLQSHHSSNQLSSGSN